MRILRQQSSVFAEIFTSKGSTLVTGKPRGKSWSELKQTLYQGSTILEL